MTQNAEVPRLPSPARRELSAYQNAGLPSVRARYPVSLQPPVACQRAPWPHGGCCQSL